MNTKTQEAFNKWWDEVGSEAPTFEADMYEHCKKIALMAYQEALEQPAQEYDAIIESLWSIIDDIDSYGDVAKSNDKLYRELVEQRQKDRFNTGITTDGYSLNIPSHPASQPAQEPVAWAVEDVVKNQFVEGRPRRVWYECKKGVGLPLYTHPAPSWQGLSDDEISKVISDEQIPVRTGKTANRFARAIEAKLKEKNT